MYNKMIFLQTPSEVRTEYVAEKCQIHVHWSVAAGFSQELS